MKKSHLILSNKQSSNFIRTARLKLSKMTLKHLAEFRFHTVKSTSRTMIKTSIFCSFFARTAPLHVPINHSVKLTNRRSPAANTHKTTKSLHFIRLILVNSSAKTKRNIERCTCPPLFRYHFQFFDLSNTSCQNHFHKIFRSLTHIFPPFRSREKTKRIQVHSPHFHPCKNHSAVPSNAKLIIFHVEPF